MKGDKKTKNQLLDELERGIMRSDALYQVSNRLAGAHDTDEVLDLIVNEAVRLLSAKAAWTRLLRNAVLVLGAATESAVAYVGEVAESTPTFGVEEGRSNAGHVMATKEPFVMEDVVTEGFTSEAERRRNQEYGFHGSVIVPLLANDRPIGVLIVTDGQVRRFTANEVSVLTSFVDQAALALQKARFLQEAKTRKRQQPSRSVTREGQPESGQPQRGQPPGSGLGWSQPP